jgi:hypothetical protein
MNKEYIYVWPDGGWVMSRDYNDNEDAWRGMDFISIPLDRVRFCEYCGELILLGNNCPNPHKEK